MAQKVIIRDRISGKTTSFEMKEKRNLEHFQAQLRNKHIVFKDRTKYTRKVKHKKGEF